MYVCVWFLEKFISYVMYWVNRPSSALHNYNVFSTKDSVYIEVTYKR